MPRRRPMLDMLRPTMVIRAQAFRKGIFGSSSFWRVIAVMIIGKRLMKQWFGRSPEVIEINTMKGGGHVMEIRTFEKANRRERRRGAA